MRLADGGLSVVVRPCGLLVGEGLRSAPEPCRACPLPPSPARGVAKLCSHHHPWAPHTPVRGEDGGVTAREALGVTALRQLAPPPRTKRQGVACLSPHWPSRGPSVDAPHLRPFSGSPEHPWAGLRCQGPLSHTRSSDALGGAACEGGDKTSTNGGSRRWPAQLHFEEKHFLTTAFISHPTPPWLHLNTCCFELPSPQTPSSLGGGRGLALPSLLSLGACDSRPDPPAFQPSPHHLSTRRPRG